MSQRRERIMDSAYRAYGERHFRRLIWQERHLPWLLPVAGVLVLGWVAARFAPPAVDAAGGMVTSVAGVLGGVPWLLLAVPVLGALLVAVVARARRPYRYPRRRWFRRGY